MNYIKSSNEQPLGKVTNIWWRHEYQDSKGNLSHIHALIWTDNAESQEIKLDRIRGSTIDLVRNDEELDVLVRDKILKSPSDIYNVQFLEIEFKVNSKYCLL